VDGNRPSSQWNERVGGGGGGNLTPWNSFKLTYTTAKHLLQSYASSSLREWKMWHLFRNLRFIGAK
jgi:hypothetical protein